MAMKPSCASADHADRASDVGHAPDVVNDEHDAGLVDRSG
jgi:hypothetical protein